VVGERCVGGGRVCESYEQSVDCQEQSDLTWERDI